MYYTRESYTNFLDTEINAQIRDFEQVVRTKALVLKSRGNVFVGKFQKLQDNGTAVFKVRNSDNMPRKNSFWTDSGTIILEFLKFSDKDISTRF